MTRGCQPSTSTRSRQRGLGLLEVLVSIVVLALGLLGLAALQITALKGGHGAYLRSQASLLAYDMGDRLRAARDTGAPNYVVALGEPPVCDRTFVPEEGTPLPAADVAEWRNALACLLPAGNGSVTRVGVTAVYDISVQWTDREADAGGSTNAQIDLRVQL